MTWGLVSALGSAIRSGDAGLTSVPGLLRKTLEEEAWRDFTTPRGELVHHDHIDDFITTPPTHGLGATVDLIQRLIGADNEAAVLFRNARKRLPGRPKDGHESRTNSTQLGRTTRVATLDRLTRERPDLRERVDRKELSANAAAVEAGFTPRSITIRLTTPESIAQTLRRQLDADMLAAVLKELDSA